MVNTFYIIPVLFLINLHLVICNHNSHENKWPLILSKLEFLWKNKTDSLPFTTTTTSEKTTESLNDKDDKWPLIFSKLEEFIWKNKTTSTTTQLTESLDTGGNHWYTHEVISTTETSTNIVQNGTFMENVKDTFNSSLAFLIGVPLGGLVLLFCVCYCCCRCCAACCCESREEGKVIVLQQNNVQPAPVAAPQHTTQVILQQPVYQTPVYGFQPAVAPPQYMPAPPQQQWAAAPAYPPGAYDNPDFAEPSAPPPQYGKY